MKIDECSLRPLAAEDIEMVLGWRNSDRVRKKMLSSHLITREEHVAWFHRIYGDSSQAHFVFEYLGTPIGLVYFNQFKKEKRESNWGFYIGEPSRHPGCGTAMGIMGLDLFFGDFQMDRIRGEVLRENIGSHQFHLRLGFQKQGEDKNLVIYGLSAKNWYAHRLQVIESLARKNEK